LSAYIERIDKCNEEINNLSELVQEKTINDNENNEEIENTEGFDDSSESDFEDLDDFDRMITAHENKAQELIENQRMLRKDISRYINDINKLLRIPKS
jgi:hypothetical protein